MSLTCFLHGSTSDCDLGPLDPGPADNDSGSVRKRVLLLREGPVETVRRHPDVTALRRQGWEVDSIYPIGPEKQKRRLLVLLNRPKDRLEDS
jgi:hypothetical protein